MTISEAVAAARECVPVVFEDPMLGPMVFARIKEIAKVYRTPAEIERGYEQEDYFLTLESMRCPGRSQHVCPLDMVRIATSQDIVSSGIPDELEHRRQVAENAQRIRDAREAET